MAGLYVHIPFCASRCIYCDFFSTVRLEERERYVDTLHKELTNRLSCSPWNTQTSFQTIYLGGGTPSQLTHEQLSRLFDHIYSSCSIEPDAEVTMECNPEDIDHEFLTKLRHLPVNRLSMGVQTFDDERLRFLHRRHTSDKALEAVAACQDAGYGNISIDLMFGFPGETLEAWESDLTEALKLDVQHLSAYSLMVEEGTRLHQLMQSGALLPLDEETSLQQYIMLTEHMTASGYEHYEISNFSKPGFRSRHNSSYWQGIPYLGIGAGAHSYDGRSRRWNASSLDTYINGVEQSQVYSESEQLSDRDRYNEYVMTRLRTSEGIDLSDFKQRFSPFHFRYLLENLKKHTDGGNVVKTADNIHLSVKGIYVSDCVMSDLFML